MAKSSVDLDQFHHFQRIILLSISLIFTSDYYAYSLKSSNKTPPDMRAAVAEALISYIRSNDPQDLSAEDLRQFNRILQETFREEDLQMGPELRKFLDQIEAGIQGIILALEYDNVTEGIDDIVKITSLHNKQTELTAGFVNSAAIGLFGGGVILPVVALSFPLTAAPPSGALTLVTVVIWGLFAIGLHWKARTMLEGMR